jgi:hypothetical protein
MFGSKKTICSFVHTIQHLTNINLFLFFIQARLNDRDEIRRKLAAGNESEGENEDYYTSDYIKKTMVTSSHRRRQGTSISLSTPLIDLFCFNENDAINHD